MTVVISKNPLSLSYSVYIYINDLIADKLALLDDNEEDDNKPDPTDQDNNKTFDDWVNEHKQTFNNFDSSISIHFFSSLHISS